MGKRTREQRRAAKKLLKKAPGRFLPIDLDKTPHPAFITRAYKNNAYVVMVDDNANINGVPAIKAMVQRHSNSPIPSHWREMQNIKNEIFGAEATAIEFYPPESKLCDEANIYWMWVLTDDLFPEADRGE